MEQRDVKLRVELDLGDAAAKADGLTAPQPRNPAAPQVPGSPTPDAGAGQGREIGPREGTGPRGGDDAAERTGADEEEIERRVTERVRREVFQIMHTVAGGGGRVSDQLIGIAAGFAAPIPGAAGGIRAAEFAERYGTPALAAAAAALPEEMRPALTAARRAAEGLVVGIAAARSAVDAVGPAFEQTVEMAGASQRFFGSSDPEFLRLAFRHGYEINRTMLEAEATRVRVNREWGAEALGDAVGKLLSDGLSGSHR